MIDYSYRDLFDTYKRLGLDSGKVVYVTGNFGRLGRYYNKQKNILLRDHVNVIQELIGDEGTLIVPTHSWSLCNTDKLFDPQSTKSEEGPFTEYVRQQKNSVRQFHPFASVTALGNKAVEICTNNSRNAYGWESPFQRMVDLNAMYVSIGQPMETSISLVHHIELMMGVPYRYTKEFTQPCLVDGTVKMIEFYLYVTRKESDIVRDCNRNIMYTFKENNTVTRTKIGRSYAESLSMAEFFQSTTKMFADNIYVYLKSPPTSRPYRK